MVDNNNFLDDFVVSFKKSRNDKEDMPLLPELTWLPAKIKQITKRAVPKTQNFRAQFTFVITSGKHNGQYAWGSVPLHEEVTDKAQLYGWICAILDKKELGPDDSVRFGDLVGKPVEIMVKNTKSKTSDKIYQNVTEIKAGKAEEVEEENSIEDLQGYDTEEEIEEEVVNEPEKAPKKVEQKQAQKVTKKPVVEEEISEDDLPF